MRAPSQPPRFVSVLLASLLAGAGLVATVAVAPTAEALSGNVYVSPSGSDAGNTCVTKTSPCRTVTYAATQTTDGGTINVSGTLVENISLSKAVTIDGTGAAAPAVLDGGNAGRVVLADAGVTLRGLTVTHGHATVGAGEVPDGEGGGVRAFGSTVLDRATVTANVSDRSGGGLSVIGSVVVRDSLVSTNQASMCATCSTSLGGGGVFVVNGSSAVERSRFTGNTARGRGGAVQMGSGTTTTTITDSTFDANTAGLGGGAVLVANNGSLLVRSSTLTGNFGSDVLHLTGDGTGYILGSTIVGNTPSTGFGGQAIFSTPGGNGALQHIAGSILDNAADECEFGAFPVGGTVTSDGRNVFEDASCATSNATDTVGTASNLAALAGNGGPTPTRLPNVGSPALGKVPAGTAVAGTTLCARRDQRGVPSSGACAAGAVERITATAPAFTSAASTSGAAGSTLDFPVTTTAGATPSLKVAAGTLPPGVTFTDNRDGTGTLGGTPTSAGAFSFTLIANNGIGGDKTQAFTLTVSKAVQAPLTVTSNATVYSPTPNFTLTTSGGSGTGAVTYTATNGTATGCAIAAGKLTYTSAGTCSVTATKAGDGTYQPASSSPTVVTIAKAAQTPAVTVTSTAGTVGTPLTLTATGGVGGAGTYTFAATNGTATGCSVAAGALSATGPGTCQVTATRPASTNYLALASAPTAVTLKQNQPTLTVTSTTGIVGSPLALTTSGGSGSGAVTFALTSGTGCTLTGANLSATSVTTCTVTAGKAGDGSNNPATSAATPVAFRLAQTVLTLTSVDGVAGSSLPLTTSGGTGAGAVSFSAVNGTATGCGFFLAGSLSASGGGTCIVTATKAGDATHAPVSSVPTTVTFRIPQTSAPQVTSTVGDLGTPLTLTSTGGSGSGAVTFTVVNGTAAGCAITAGALSATAGGTCTVTATKAQDAVYQARSSVPTAVNVRLAQAPLTITSLNGTVNTPFTLTTAGGSGTGAVSYAPDPTFVSSSNCVLTGNQVTAPVPGWCFLIATKAGDGTYAPVSSASTGVYFRKPQEDPVTVVTTFGTFNTPRHLDIAGGSGSGQPSFEVVAGGSAPGCAIQNLTLLVSDGAGTCIVVGTRGADQMYLARSSDPAVVTLDKAQPPLMTLTSTTGFVGDPLTLTSSGGGGSTGPVTYSVLSGSSAPGCLIASGVLTAQGSGDCHVQVFKNVDANYSFTSGEGYVTFHYRQQPLTVTSLNGVVGTPLPLTTGGGSGAGAVTYTVANGTATGCVIVSGELSVATNGTCTVAATKAAEGIYWSASAPPVAVTFKIAQAALTMTPVDGLVGTPTVLSTAGGTGPGAVTYTVTNGTGSGCAVTGTSLTSTGGGTCLVTATKAGNATYLPVSSAPTAFTLRQAQPPLTVLDRVGEVGQPAGIFAVGGAGTGELTFDVSNGTSPSCVAVGSAITALDPGTCLVVLHKAADGQYLAATSPQKTITFKYFQDALTVSSLQGVVGTPLTLTSSGGNGTGAVTFTVVDGTATGCAVTAGKLSSATTGTCTVTPTKAADASYYAKAGTAAAVTMLSAQDALLVTSVDGIIGTPLALTTSGGAGTGALSFSVVNGTATGCAVTGSNLGATTAGTCTVTATKAADATHGAVSSTPTAVTFKNNQATLTVTSLNGAVGTSLALTASGGSGTGALSYAVTNGTATGCVVTGTNLTATTAGTCTVTATKAADATFVAKSSTPTAVTFKQGQAALTVTSVAGVVGTALTLTSSGGSGTGAVTFVVVNGTATGCAIASGALSATSAGTCTVTATKAADATFGVKSSLPTAVTFKNNQTALTVTSTNGTFGFPVTLTTSGGSGTGALTFAVTTGTATGCAITSGKLSVTTAGTCSVTATKAADATFNAASSPSTTVTIGKASQVISFVSTAPSNAAVGLTTYTPVTLGGNSGNAVVLSLDASSTGCTLNGGTVSFPGAGTCVLNADQAGNGNYAAAPTEQQSFAVGKATQAISFTSTAPSGATVGRPAYALAATGGTSGNPVTFSLDASSTGCTLASSTISFPAVGTCVVNANQAGNANYTAAPQVQQTFAIGKGAQAITFTSTAPVNAAIGGNYTVAATGGGSGAPVTFALDGSSTGCTLAGSLLTFTGSGTCVVDANQAGTASYTAAPQVQQAFDVGKADQVITFTSNVPAGKTVGGASYTATANGGDSGKPVTFSLDASSTGCALAGSTVTFPHAGTCTIDANQAGDANYAAAPQVQQTFAVGTASQAIAFTSSAPVGKAVGGTDYVVAADGGPSGQPVVFTLDGSSTGCTLSGSTVSFPAAGTCVVNANQAGNADYAAAPQTQQSFTVGQGTQAINFTSTAPVGKVVGGASYTVTATGGGSGNPVTFSLDATSTGCTLSGSTVSFPAVGICKIDADQAGNASFGAAPQVQQSFATGKASQVVAITSTPPVNPVAGRPAYALTGTGGASGKPVTFSLDATSTGCTLAGNTVSFPHIGTCVVDANQDGNANYLPAAPAQQSFTIGKAGQSITFTSVPGTRSVGGSAYTVQATGGGSGVPVTFALDAASTGCAITGASVTFTAVGTCVLNADQAGNADYFAAPQLQQSFAVTVASTKIATRTTLSITKVTYQGKVYWKISTTVKTATGNATGPVVIKDTRPGHPTRGLCYLTLKGGAAKCLVPVGGIGAGVHLMTASYKATATFGSSFKTISKVF